MWWLPKAPYYFDPRIHNLGNVNSFRNFGVGGTIHAEGARFATRVVDCVAYGETDVRRELLDEFPRDMRIVDLCCGVGTSTRDLGVDTSKEMLRVARRASTKRFVLANAETYGVEDNYDLATCFFAMHEIPGHARRRILNNMLRIAPSALVVDIPPAGGDWRAYEPSRLMLTGEPYLTDYIERFGYDVHAAACASRANVTARQLLRGRVVVWHFDRRA
jgi:SAM-dependent methyltransferase